MLLTTLASIPGKPFEVLGLVRGTYVQCDRDSYSDVVRDVTDDMIHAAEWLGADAVVDLRYETAGNSLAGESGTALPFCIAYGTAVKFTEEDV